MRAQAGITLIEIMATILVVGIITVAVTSAYVSALNLQRNQMQTVSTMDRTRDLERKITKLLQGAKLSDLPYTTDQTTYFQSDTQSSAGGDLGTDRITFTTVWPGIPLSAMHDQNDFETQQQNLQGPVAGVAEISLGTTPVGDPGDKTGLFERVQLPSDGDPTQGGLESVLSPDVDQIGFQFWDGTEWTSTWDSTTTPDTNQLPCAVLVSYILKNDPQQTIHTFTVPLFTSNVTEQNPISNGGTATP